MALATTMKSWGFSKDGRTRYPKFVMIPRIGPAMLPDEHSVPDLPLLGRLGSIVTHCDYKYWSVMNM